MRVDIGGGVRVFVDVVGSGFDHSTLRPYFDRFADTHQVIYYDHRGQGRSDERHDPSGWDLDTWADDVVRLVDALGIEHPVVLGTSFGGFVAIRYAARHPDHPSKLIVSSTLARRNFELSASRFEARGGPEAAASYRRLFVDGDQSMESWIEYARLNLPVYNNTPSAFGPRRTWENLEVIQHFHEPFAEMDLRDDVRRIAA